MLARYDNGRSSFGGFGVKFLAAVFAALMLVAAPASAIAQERVTAPVGGISIAIPKSWHLIPPDESLKNMKGFDLENPQIAAEVKAPLITIMRERPENAAGIIPTIKASFTPYPGSGNRGAVAITEELVSQMPQIFPDFKVLTPTRPVTIAGRPGAGVRVGFSLKMGGELMPVETELYIVPQGKAGIFVIGFSYLGGQEPALRPTFDAALASVRIDAK